MYVTAIELWQWLVGCWDEKEDKASESKHMQQATVSDVGCCCFTAHKKEWRSATAAINKRGVLIPM